MNKNHKPQAHVFIFGIYHWRQEQLGSAAEMGREEMKILSEVLKPPKNHRQKKPVYFSLQSCALVCTGTVWSWNTFKMSHGQTRWKNGWCGLNGGLAPAVHNTVQACHWGQRKWMSQLNNNMSFWLLQLKARPSWTHILPYRVYLEIQHNLALQPVVTPFPFSLHK